MVMPLPSFNTPDEEPQPLYSRSVESNIEALEVLTRCIDMILGRLSAKVADISEPQHAHIREILGSLPGADRSFGDAWLEEHFGATALRRFFGEQE